MHHAIRHGMDRRANGSGQIDAVVEVPAIRVDARTEGRVHFVRRDALVEGPDEKRVADLLRPSSRKIQAAWGWHAPGR